MVRQVSPANDMKKWSPKFYKLSASSSHQWDRKRDFMKLYSYLSAVAFSLLAMPLMCCATNAKTNQSVDSKIVTITVTAEGSDGQSQPHLRREDIEVLQKSKPMEVVGWTKAQGPLNLYILVDDSISSQTGAQLGDLGDFIRSLPTNTRVAIGYASNGTSRIAQDFTEDKNLAVGALRIPMGASGAMASPYLSLADLVERFPDVPERRAILLISSGYDPFGGNSISNPYATMAIERAQKKNVQVFAIYANSIFRRGRRYFQVFNAQGNLAKVADETGGDAYFLGIDTPISFKPFLDNCLIALQNQYILKVSVPWKEKEYWTSLEITTKVTGVEFDHATNSWVPAQQ